MSQDYSNSVLKTIKRAKQIAIENGTYTQTGIFSLLEYNDFQPQKASLKRKSISDDDSFDEEYKRIKVDEFLYEREKELLRLYNEDVTSSNELSRKIQERLEVMDIQNSINQMAIEFWENHKSEQPVNLDKVLKDLIKK
jgi:hypothetical protein